MKNKLILNIGGGLSRKIPDHYPETEWEQHLLDIDPNVKPDIVGDAKDLNVCDKYDAVFMSHIIEHVYKHDVSVVLSNVFNALKSEGIVEIHTPDVNDIISKLANSTLDLHDVYYRLADGSCVTYHDVLYGWNIAMSSGNLYFSHKCGFTKIFLEEQLKKVGFINITVHSIGGNLMALAKKK